MTDQPDTPQVKTEAGDERMVPISHNDMKLMADILSDIADDDDNIPTAIPPIVQPFTQNTSDRKRCPPWHPPHPGQPGFHAKPNITTSFNYSSVEGNPSPDTKPSNKQRIVAQRRNKINSVGGKTCLSEIVKGIYDYLNENGEVCLTDDRLLDRLGNPDFRRIYDAVRWLEGIGLVCREKSKGTKRSEGVTMIYLIYEDGSTLKSMRDKLNGI
jgi:hypothetical protein